ncbi:MAG: MipA family protein [Sphingomonadales bacterium]|nr:MipA family protein [Sphingomonadales bacterium]
MKPWTLLGAAACALPLALAAPAAAQEKTDSYQDRPNSLTIGIGGGYLPSYEGSDDYQWVPIGLALGKVGGFGFATRGTTLTLDLIRDAPGAPVSFEFGPAANLRLDRSSHIKDPQVRALGKIDRAVEVGAYAGVAKNRLLDPYDSLALRVTWLHDVSGTHGSSILSPSIEYSTPLSPKTYALLSASADHVGRGYAQTYFSITPAGAVRSGLPVFNATSGWKSVRLSLFLAQTLAGDLRRPRLSLFAGVSYSRLLNDFRRSPIVSVAGSPNQYLAAAGLAYSF